MIFGKTYEEVAISHKWFAWYPIRLDTLQIAWLEYVNKTIRSTVAGEYAKYSKYIKENNGN